MTEDKKSKKPTEQAQSMNPSTEGQWESPEEFRKWAEESLDEVVDNLNENVLKEDQEKESEEGS